MLPKPKKQIKKEGNLLASSLTTEVVSNCLFNKYGDEFEILSEYSHSKESLLVKHTGKSFGTNKQCNHVWECTWSNLKLGRTCPICSEKRSNYLKFLNGKRSFYNYLEKASDRDEYVFLESYRGSDTHILVNHKECNTTYKVTPSNFMKDCRCNTCYVQTQSKSDDQFKQEVFEAVGTEYTFLEDYSGSKTPIKVRHNTCKHHYPVIPANFLYGGTYGCGTRCPKCKASHGEKKISIYLKTMCISYKSEYKLEDCSNVSPLPFDFAVFNNNNLIALIEFDGEQHFKPIKHFGGESKLKLTQLNDEIKNNYCKVNSIPLIRIPYTDFDRVELILDDELLPLLFSTSTE